MIYLWYSNSNKSSMWYFS